MEADWYVTTDGRRHGPYTRPQLIFMARQGRLMPTDLVGQIAGLEEAAGQVRWLFDGGARVEPIESATVVLPPRTAAGGSDRWRGSLPTPQLPPSVAPPIHPQPPPTAASYSAPPPGLPPTAAPLPSAAPLHAAMYRPSAPMAAPLPTSATMTGAALGTSPTSSYRPKRGGGALERFLITGAAIVVGAAAAVFIYVNLEALESKVLGTRRESPNGETPVAAPASVVPPTAVTPPSSKAPPSTSQNNDDGFDDAEFR